MMTRPLGDYEPPIALFSYCISSIAMTTLNKYVLSQHKFHLNFLLLFFQSIMTVVFLVACRRAGILTFRPFNWKDAMGWLPVSLALKLMIFSGSKSLQYLTVAMFTVFKNMTIVFIALTERQLFGNAITPTMWIAFALIIASSLVGAANDLAFSLRGYCWMLFNCFISAAYTLYMRVSIRRAGFADFDSVFFNNLLVVPFLLVSSLLFDDWNEFYADYFHGGELVSHRGALFAGILASSFFAFGISYATAWSVRVTSSTTYSMVGALNKLPIAISGILFFTSERSITNWGSILSIIIATLSGIVYCYAQILNRRQSPTALSPTLPSRVRLTPDPSKTQLSTKEVEEAGVLLKNMEEANHKDCK